MARLVPVYTEEEMAWNAWLDVTNYVLVPAIMDEALAALPAVAIAYGWDHKKKTWGVVPWTVLGEVPALIGYHGGPLHITNSHEPPPTRDPCAGLMIGSTLIGTPKGKRTNAGASAYHETPCTIIDCYIEADP
jgi:hypothetical protein